MARGRKVDLVWEKLDAKYGLLAEVRRSGQVELSAKQIKEIGEEARLVTKFDDDAELPAFLKKHQLAILPSRRGGYVIGHFDMYQVLPSITPKAEIYRPKSIPESLRLRDITSEAAALNLLYVSGLLQEFSGEEGLVPAVNGRMSAGTINYLVRNLKSDAAYSLCAEKPQIEIDAGFEGERSLILIEAKKSRPEAFNRRQVYFPYVTWSKIISKRVRNVFMIHSGDEFELLEYEFQSRDEIGSMLLTKHRKFVLDKYTFTAAELCRVANKTTDLDWLQSGAPYPQADSVPKLIELLFLLAKSPLTKKEISAHFDFNERQSDYYANALNFLGLAHRISKGLWDLTPDGRDLVEKPAELQKQDLTRRFIRVPAIRRYILLTKGNLGSDGSELERLVEEDFNHPEIRKRSKETSKLGSTEKRRKVTVKAWVAWIRTVSG